MDDGKGMKLHQTVELYARNQNRWLVDFVNAWEKMSQNGNSGLIQGPKNFWTHLTKKQIFATNNPQIKDI